VDSIFLRKDWLLLFVVGFSAATETTVPAVIPRHYPVTTVTSIVVLAVASLRYLSHNKKLLID